MRTTIKKNSWSASADPAQHGRHECHLHDRHYKCSVGILVGRVTPVAVAVTPLDVSLVRRLHVTAFRKFVVHVLDTVLGCHSHVWKKGTKSYTHIDWWAEIMKTLLTNNWTYSYIDSVYIVIELSLYHEFLWIFFII